ncbi:SAM-dependent methyltransferase [Pendulispora albinea]|uniref:S-adenosyl-L-methionine-dependent methyltransferase n=1 Tax=Pendulispora albinea TaxID=2741071 RepID=A0ABZ2MC63_9BACT
MLSALRDDLATDLSFIETTALTIAHYRALESARPDRLFFDPFASAFVEAAGRAGDSASQLPAAPADYFAVRTKYFDEYVERACAAGCPQVVILAAGLDARAFRLALPPEVRLFEVELATMLRFKESVLAKTRARAKCDRILVPSDLRDDWPAALSRIGFRHDVPTAWLVEGLLFYLTKADGDRLLQRIARLSVLGSRIGLEHVNQATRDGMAATLAALAARGAPWQSSVEDPAAWLAGLGWNARVSDQGKLGRRYGRAPALPAADDPGSGPKAWLVEGWLIEPGARADRP